VILLQIYGPDDVKIPRGVALIYGMTFGIGKIIFGDLITGGILLFIAGVGFFIIYLGLRKGFD
jgi:hypothetical protein